MRPIALAVLTAIVLAPAALAQSPDWEVYPTWPFDAPEAARRQTETAALLGTDPQRQIDLGDGLTVTLVLIPAGSFELGAPMDESPLDPDESPAHSATVAKPFWLATVETTNRLYAAFDPTHDSRFMDTNFKDRVGPGLPLNQPDQPVVRIPWLEATAFTRWLARRTGLPFRLPTEAEWEYACRAGTDTPWSCGQSDLPAHANFADASLGGVKPWALRDNSVSDGMAVTAPVGHYHPNAWGLYDMHGNACEWTASRYLPYPYDPSVAEAPGTPDACAVRGGSFDDRPRRVRSAFRQSYPPDFAIYNVGFRVACDVR